MRAGLLYVQNNTNDYFTFEILVVEVEAHENVVGDPVNRVLSTRGKRLVRQRNDHRPQ